MYEIITAVCVIVLIYAYAGYPLALYVLCFFKPKKQVDGEAQVNSVSIVCCVHNEAGQVAKRIENLLNQKDMRCPVEIVVASDGSTDGTAGMVRQYADRQVKLLAFHEWRGKAAVLNDVVPQLGGEIVVFCDVRQEFESKALSLLLRRFGDPGVGAVSGELVFRDAGGTGGTAGGVAVYWDYEKSVRKLESCMGSVCGCTGAIYAVRKELWRPLHPDTILDDVAVPMNVVMAGKRVVFEPDAVAFDDPAGSYVEERRRKIRTLAGNIQLVALYPSLLNPFKNRLFMQFVSHKLVRIACPFVMVLLLGVSAVWSFSSPVGRVLLSLQAVFYAAGVAGFTLLRAGRRAGVVKLPGIFVMMNWFAVLGVFNFLSGRLNAAWGCRGENG